MKYVIIDDVFPIIFSDAQKHVDFKKMGNITSAGMLSIRSKGEYDANTEETTSLIEVSCFSEAVSLKLKPAKTDELRIKTMFEKY